MVDMHSHILPEIDDGSDSVETSLNMLKESYRQGVDTVLATPHFYIKENDVNSFLEKREMAYEKLINSIKGEKDIPKIYKAAEVYYFNGISKYENVEKLAINGGKYILLEMPFVKWNSRVFQEVEDLIYNRKLIPIIAHLERYIKAQNGTDNIDRLLSMKVIPQMNGEYLFGFFNKGKALKWLDNGVIRLLGSDMHNTTNRAQNLGKAKEVIEKKLGSNILEEIEKFSKEIIGIN